MGATIEYVSREKHLANMIGLDCNKSQINDGLNIFNNRVRSNFGHTQHEVLYYSNQKIITFIQELITQEWTAFLAQKSPKMLIFKAM